MRPNHTSDAGGTRMPDNGGPAPRTFHAPETTLRDYLRVVSTRRWLVVSSFLVLVTLAGLWVFTRTPLYSSSAQLRISPGDTAVTPFAQVVDETTLAARPQASFIETQMRLVTTDRLTERTFNHFGIGKKPGFRDAANPLQGFKGRFSVSRVRRTFLVDVSFLWPDPKRGAEILDWHVREFVRDYGDQKSQRAEEALQKLQRQKDELDVTVDELTDEIRSFKYREGVDAFDKNYDTVASTLKEKEQSLEQARQTWSELQTRLAEIKKARETGSLENVPDVIKSPLIKEYRWERMARDQELRELLKNWGEKHPKVISLRAKLAVIDESIAKEVDRIQGRVEKELSAAKSLGTLRQAEVEEQRERRRKFTDLRLEFQELKDQLEDKRQTRKSIRDRIDQIRIVNETSLKGETIAIEGHPKPETQPAKPRKTLVMCLASVLGLAVGVGLAFLFDILDTTLKTKEDVARQLGLNLLGYVPEIPELQAARRKHSRVALAVPQSPRSPAAEAFRSIRTALSFSLAANEVELVLVTSPSPSEGKTLCAVNMAAAIAQTGKRVLLVDADMRRPALHKVFETEQIPGLTNLLVEEGATRPEDVIRETDVPNLSLVCSGPTPPNPAELVGCDRMNALLAHLEAQFDQVIIDSPPAVNVTDATVLSRAGRGVVLVLRSFRTERDLARRAVEVLAESGGRLLGVVLNNVDVPRGAYYYDSYYRYHQYYYYSEDGTKKKRKSRRKASRDGQKATA